MKKGLPDKEVPKVPLGDKRFYQSLLPPTGYQK